MYLIENFEKTNGFEKDSKTYIADVKYVIVFKKGVAELSEDLKRKSQGSAFGEMGTAFGVLALQMQYGNFKAGHRVEKEDKIVFIKTENGWRISASE